MTKLFTIRSWGFWVAAATCLLPFVLLAFLNSMALDDYLFYDLYRVKGFFGTQYDLYLTWAGRYTSAFITGSYVRLDLPGRFPFLPTLLYFAFTWGAACCLLSSLRRLLPAGSFPRKGIYGAGAVLFFLFLYVQFDIATGFFWFSSVTVYQTAFVLFLLLSAVLVRKLGASGERMAGSGTARPATVRPATVRPSIARPAGNFLSILLILLIMGCNEIMAVFLPLFLALLAAAFYFYKRPIPRWLWLSLATAIAIGIFIFFTSGVMTYRYRLMNSTTSTLSILPMIGFRMMTVLFYIFKEPLFWLCAAGIFIFGTEISKQLDAVGPLAVLREKDIFFPGLLALLLVVLSTLSVFLLASRGSIPPRALNNLSDVTACCLLALSFIAGIRKGAQLSAPLLPGVPPGIRLALLVCVLLASTNYGEAWKSVLSGYFYHAVMADRSRQLRAAAKEHRHSAIVLSYDAALNQEIDRAFPHGTFRTVRDLALQKPALLFFYDGAGTGDPAYAHFYGLDSIIVRDK